MIVSSTGNYNFRCEDTYYPPPLQHCVMATRRYSLTALTKWGTVATAVAMGLISIVTTASATMVEAASPTADGSGQVVCGTGAAGSERDTEGEEGGGGFGDTRSMVTCLQRPSYERCSSAPPE